MSIALEVPKGGTVLNIGVDLGECEFGKVRLTVDGLRGALAFLKNKDGGEKRKKRRFTDLIVGHMAARMIDSLSVVPVQKISRRLVAVDWDDLGLDKEKGATNEELWRRGIDLGLEMCPPEAAPWFLLQKIGEIDFPYLRFAMEPISVAPWICLPDVVRTKEQRALNRKLTQRQGKKEFCSFVISRDPEHPGEIWLDASGGDPGCFWQGLGRDMLVFVAPS